MEAGVKERCPPHAIGAAGEDGGAERWERKNGGPPHAIGAAGEDGGGWGVRKHIGNLTMRWFHRYGTCPMRNLGF